MKKKVISVLLTAAMLTGLLAGCGNNGNDSNTNSATDDNTTPAQTDSTPSDTTQTSLDSTAATSSGEPILQ